MIVYDGISLNSIAGVKVKDVQVSPIAYDEVTRPRAISGGSVFVRSRAGTRTVVITFALIEENDINRQNALLAISQWAKNDKEYRLELPGHPEHYLMAICTDKPEPSLRQWWESKLRLVFTCYDNPYWNSKYERSFLTSASYDTTVFIQGDAPPLLRITRDNRSTIVRTMSLDGQAITFNNSLPAGILEIDVNKQIVTVDGNSAMQYYVPTSRFFVPHPGSQVIRGGGCYFRFRERWQ